MIPADSVYKSVPPSGFERGTVALSDILITEQLARRPSRAPDHAREAQALLTLTDSMNAMPHQILHTLCEIAVQLTGAHSAGISLLEDDDDHKIFRWHAISGQLNRYLGGTMPRYFSPCGLVVDGDSTLLMRLPVLFFPYIAQLHVPVVEVLLVPFYRNGTAVGTVWVVSHDEEKQFDSEDCRSVSSLARFAAAAVTVKNNLMALEETQRRLEAEIAERAAREQRRAEFLATLAHELRNPLAPLRNGLELLKAAGNESLDGIRVLMERQLGHLTRLVDDLFDTACINSGKLELNRVVVDLRNTVNSAVEICLPVIDGFRHRLSLAMPDEPLYVEADATRLVQIFANLLNNAAKYTPAGGEIQLRVSASAADLTVEVADNGFGISEEMRSTIFEMYSQDERTRKRGNGGLGVGLPLVKKLVELHGGQVCAQSPGPNLGSVFRVQLPRAPAPPRKSAAL